MRAQSEAPHGWTQVRHTTQGVLHSIASGLYEKLPAVWAGCFRGTLERVSPGGFFCLSFLEDRLFVMHFGNEALIRGGDYAGGFRYM